MSWVIKAKSDIGGREEQQDRYLVVSSTDGRNHLLVVADGAGGHKTGAAAAQTAIDCIRENLELLWSSKDPDMFLNELINKCNERVLKVGGSEMACTTLVLVLIRGDEIFWGNVGDSRFYLIRDGNVVIKTTDHSVIELERQQAVQDADVAISASSNKLYMCLGALANIVPEVSSSLVRAGDTVLLCSDGLWGQTDMEPLIAELSEQPLTIEFLNKWTKKAKVSKSDRSDNVTLVAARFMSEQSFMSNPFKAITSFFKR